MIMEITWTREVATTATIKRADVKRLVTLIAEHEDSTEDYDSVGAMAASGKLAETYPDACHAFVAELEERHRGEESERGDVDSIIFTV